MKVLSIRLVGLLVLGVSMFVTPQLLWAQGNLETPAPGSFQSGIGLVRGWVCQANRVEIEVVGRGTLPAVYGQLRGDTQAPVTGKPIMASA